MRTSLSFEGSPPSLVQISFEHSQLEQERISIRGGGLGATRAFPWSKAVKALSLLMVRAALISRCPKKFPDKILLRGYQGSPAASLDYAISKLPRWLSEVFGTDSEGRSLLLRFFSRTNSNLKRPGPVAFSIICSEFLAESILIFHDGRALEFVEGLEALERALEADISAPGKQRVRGNVTSRALPSWIHPRLRAEFNFLLERESNYQSFDPAFGGNGFLLHVREEYVKQIHHALTRTPTFELNKISDLLARLRRSKCFSNYPHLELLDLKLDLSSHEIVGTSPSPRSLSSRPLLVEVGSDVSSKLLLATLRYLRGYDISLGRQRFHAQEVLSAVHAQTDDKSSPDFIVLGIRQAIDLLAESDDYQALSMLPMGRSQVLSSSRPINAADLRGDLYAYLDSSEFLEVLNKELKLYCGANVICRSALEVFNAARSTEENVFAICWFPHSLLYSKGVSSDLSAFDTIPLRQEGSSPSFAEFLEGGNILLAHREHVASGMARDMSIALRDVWCVNVQNPSISKFLIEHVLATRYEIEPYLRMSRLTAS